MPKIRQIQKTVFAFGEGETENIFLKHLRSIYANGKTHTTVDHAGGKNTSYIIQKAIRVRSFNSYNHSFIFLDTIPVWSLTDKNYAKAKSFELIGSEPSVEAIFLRILEPPKDFSTESASNCKRRFNKIYLNGNSRAINENECKKFFLKSRLDLARKYIPELNRIIEIIEGNF
jgi:hypothetical protein